MDMLTRNATAQAIKDLGIQIDADLDLVVYDLRAPLNPEQRAATRNRVLGLRATANRLSSACSALLGKLP